MKPARVHLVDRDPFMARCAQCGLFTMDILDRRRRQQLCRCALARPAAGGGR